MTFAFSSSDRGCALHPEAGAVLLLLSFSPAMLPLLARSTDEFEAEPPNPSSIGLSRCDALLHLSVEAVLVGAFGDVS